VSLEVRDRLGLAVVSDDKVGPLQVQDRLPFGVRDEDLEELQGDDDLVLEIRSLRRGLDGGGALGTLSDCLRRDQGIKGERGQG